MKFFIPFMQDEAAAERQWQSFIDDCRAPSSSERLYSVTYTHDGDKIVVTVGEAPKVFKRKTGPRGGYIKNADYVRLGRTIGTTVCGIIHAGHLIYVYQLPANSYWANPILVGPPSVLNFEAFEDDVP